MAAVKDSLREAEVMLRESKNLTNDLPTIFSKLAENIEGLFEETQSQIKVLEKDFEERKRLFNQSLYEAREQVGGLEEELEGRKDRLEYLEEENAALRDLILQLPGAFRVLTDCPDVELREVVDRAIDWLPRLATNGQEKTVPTTVIGLASVLGSFERERK